MRGVWGVIAWMMRDVGVDEEEADDERWRSTEVQNDAEMTDRE